MRHILLAVTLAAMVLPAGAHDSTGPNGGQMTDAGNLHVEVVTRAETVQVFLGDGAGKPLEVLAIEAKAFHRKAAATGVPVTLSGAGGAWSSAQEFVPGLWRIEVDATLADGQRFEKTYELTLK